MKKAAFLCIGISLFFVSGCIDGRLATASNLCKNYDFGSQVQNVDPDGGVPSDKPIEGYLAETGGITSITNLESVAMTISYFPISSLEQPKMNVVVPPGAESTQFAGLSGRGRIEVAREQAFFTERGDGADLRVCFVSLN